MGETRTLTFVFTDIEGSTKLWERDEDLMRRSLQVHDALLKRFLNQGGEIFKAVGDGFLACFESPREAVNAALEAQRELQRQVWPGPELKVRMALLTGYAEKREGDYFGRALNRASRLLALGHGGQILVAAATADLTQDVLSEGSRFVDLGEHRLRDFERAETVFQLVAAGLPESFPELRAAMVRPNNLPIEVTNLVGRDRELADVWDMVQSHRLVTLTGMGGIGKTRLSLHVAAEFLDTFQDGIWFIELAPLRERDLVAQTVASALGVRAEPGRPIAEVLLDHLRPKQTLLVLDNCEHLINDVAALVSVIQRACPGVNLIASSREPLSIPGEQVYRVQGLPTPPTGFADPEQLLRSDAVRLFVERARLAQATFRLTPENGEAVSRICAQLDGIPLAIELSAARVRAMGVAAIADRLQDRFKLLTGSARRGDPRQQTLRAAIDWSFDLLDQQEKTLLTRLSAFAGGWTLAMAESVGADEGPISGDDVLDLLSRLVEKSMVTFDEGSDRYRLLETVRQYAAEALEAAGESEDTQSRHAATLAAFAGEAAEGLLGATQESWLTRVELEHDNFRVALNFCSQPSASSQTRQMGLVMAANLWRFWDTRGLYAEGRTRLDNLLALEPDLSPARGAALDAAGRLAYYQGDFADARASFQEAAELFERLGQRGPQHHALHGLAMALANTGEEARVRPMLEACLAVFREEGDRQGVARALNALGFEALGHGDHARAEPYIQEALNVRRQLNDVQGETVALYYLGVCAVARGDLDFARKCLEQTFAINRRLNYPRGMAISLTQLAAIAVAEGKLSEGLESIQEATRQAITLGDQATITGTLAPWAALAQALGHQEAHAHLLAAVQVHKGQTGLLPRTLAMPEAAQLDRMATAFPAATAAGRSSSPAEAAEFALREVTLQPSQPAATTS
jgi:predicted ATPase/class 3 adenylate cyclase